MNNLLNVNVIFCEDFDQTSNSYINVFDSINIDNVDINGFESIILFNRAVQQEYFVAIFLCKMLDEDTLDTALAISRFEIPEDKNSKDSTNNKTETFVKHIDISTVSDKGLYSIIVFVKPKKDGDNDSEKEIIELKEYNLINRTYFTVV